MKHRALRYLLKPVSAATLRQVVGEAVEARRAAELTRLALRDYRDRSAEDASRADLRARFENALRTVRMVFQPIVRWSDRALFAHEALVRTEEHSLTRPRELYSAAATLGRLHDLARITRRSVAETVRQHNTSQPIFVNVHPRDFDDSELFSTTAPLSGFANRIVLELTEWAALEPTSDLPSRLSALRALGYRFALDDLGAGYAGLTSFAEIRPEVVKLDMSLTRGIAAEPTKQKLVHGADTICQELGVLVIAEGVETSAERDVLIGLGCDILQGYLFARPGPPFPPVTWNSDTSHRRQAHRERCRRCDALASTTRADPMKKRILIVDDDIWVAETIAAALQDYEVTVTHNGPEALAVAVTQPGVDLLDHRLPHARDERRRAGAAFS